MQHYDSSPPGCSTHGYLPVVGMHFTATAMQESRLTTKVRVYLRARPASSSQDGSSLFRFFLRFTPLLLAPLGLALAPPSLAQLPDAPSALFATALPHNFPTPSASDSHFVTSPEPYSSSVTDASLDAAPDLAPYEDLQTNAQTNSVPSTTTPSDKPQKKIITDTGTQPHRILGLMPNYRSVSAGEIPPPPGFKQSFKIATHQAFDYSTFVFLGLTTATAYG